jgi:hypothetical protein
LPVPTREPKDERCHSYGSLCGVAAPSAGSGPFDTFPFHVEPESFFLGRGSGLHYLCKFRGTLTAEEMREDLHFERALDDAPCSEWVIRW